MDELKDYELGIVTNGDSEQQRSKLEKLEIGEYYITVVSASDIGIAKPNPRIFEIACEMAKTAFRMRGQAEGCMVKSTPSKA